MDGLYKAATLTEAIMLDDNAGEINAKYGADKANVEGICSSMHMPKAPSSGSISRKASVPARQGKQQTPALIEVDMGESRTLPQLNWTSPYCQQMLAPSWLYSSC